MLKMSMALPFLAGLVAIPMLGEVAAQTPGELRAPNSFSDISDRAARSRALFGEAAKVITSPRCMNCHPAGDQPHQGDDRHVHRPPALRGEANIGVPGQHCVACHTDNNFPLSVGAASYQSIPGHPRWGLAPIEMAWEGKTPGEICRLGNLGPIASASGAIGVQIRDFDQTVIGNPAHDLVRLGLSLASAARGSDLPGVTTAKMVEQLVEGYELSFSENVSAEEDEDLPSAVHLVMVEAASRTWKHLAKERIEDTEPSIPLGKRFWPITAAEKKAIEKLFEIKHVHGLATMLRSRDDDAPVELLDAAYWMKGCSSLGLLRFAVLLGIGKKKELCLMDVKEATKAAAPRYPDTKMPSDNGERVLEGARHLSPNVGERMRSATLLDKSIFVRELLPQDLKLEIEHLNREEAMKASRYLANVVGQAHARQMDSATKKAWSKELNLNRTKSLDAPSWLWTSIVELMSSHEGAYLEHCRKYALGTLDRKK